MTSPTPPERPPLSSNGQLRNFTVHDMRVWKDSPTAPKSKARKTAAPELPPPPQSEGEAPEPMLADVDETIA